MDQNEIEPDMMLSSRQYDTEGFKRDECDSPVWCIAIYSHLRAELGQIWEMTLHIQGRVGRAQDQEKCPGTLVSQARTRIEE